MNPVFQFCKANFKFTKSGPHDGLEMFVCCSFFNGSGGQMQHLECVNDLVEEEYLSNNPTFKILPHLFQLLHNFLTVRISIYMNMFPIKL